jgi:Cu+-exporting ATPase
MISTLKEPVNTNNSFRRKSRALQKTCYHCGDSIPAGKHIAEGEKEFCCDGCRQVFILLSENDLCDFYSLSKIAGIKSAGNLRKNRFEYLDNPDVIDSLVQFKNNEQINITFHLPSIHCSSCIYLLENLHKIEKGVISSETDFIKKELFVSFNPVEISLRRIVELLSFIGYEPALSPGNLSAQSATKKKKSKGHIYRIGLAGFCFANIMMLSFPEYFSGGHVEQSLRNTFSALIFILSLPVLFFCASEFFISAIKGLRQKIINIDAPIAIAVLITFGRSYYEIISRTGAGYLDSGTGIVFFMLIGRWFQNRTYEFLSFERDYHSYFPLAVNVVKEGKESVIPVAQLKIGDRIRLRNGELIPADGILAEGNARIDYSFVTGEIAPVPAKPGEPVYAGGKQTGSSIEIIVKKDCSQSYITKLWNNDIPGIRKHKDESFIHPWSRYFTLSLFLIAGSSVVYWSVINPAHIFPVLTAVLIVACPCSLLLSATFTFGNMVRILGRNKCYLKNESVIESLAATNTIVFDKTGTLTASFLRRIEFAGEELTARERNMVRSVCKQSAHPLSREIATYLQDSTEIIPVDDFKEYPGKGIMAFAGDSQIEIGSAAFIGVDTDADAESFLATTIYLRIDSIVKGFFKISGNHYRNGIKEMSATLQKNYGIHLLSGDNSAERQNLLYLLGNNVSLHFSQSPADKLQYIKQLQTAGKKVLMAGDGLNDAGALLQADCGIAINNGSLIFTPACDVILDGEKTAMLPQILRYAKKGKTIIRTSFILSILYNVIGLSFAVSGRLSPVVAAVLMPLSSITIVCFVTVATSLAARRLKFNTKLP